MLVSSRHEFEMAYLVIAEINRTPYYPSEFPPVDKDDARKILAAFMKYITSTHDPRKAYQMMTLPFYMVHDNVSSCLADEVVPLLEAILNRTWRIMEEETPTPQETMISAFEYAGNALSTFSFVFGRAIRPWSDDRIDLSSCIAPLIHANFIELMGRLCAALVTPAVDDSRGIFLVSEAHWNTFESKLKSLLDKLNEATYHWGGSVLAMMKSCYETWARVRRYISLQIDLYSIIGPVGDRLKTCQDTWFDLGKAFGYNELEPDVEKQQCMYPRCANPYPDGGARLVCGRCCWVHYCSFKCQIAHWLSDSPDSHRRRCIHINGQWSWMN
ncbi:hypothetical protein BDV93DRAFT_339537 [Ceratobasidium sp. AG-I]|nr:hypothetical protein BDV93DRAFT_339537 [Ceratobasidium sp. AG-I]